MTIRPESSFGVKTIEVPSVLGVAGLSRITTYLTRAESDPELVYHLVKWLHELLFSLLAFTEGVGTANG